MNNPLASHCRPQYVGAKRPTFHELSKVTEKNAIISKDNAQLALFELYEFTSHLLSRDRFSLSLVRFIFTLPSESRS